jgi:flagellar hook assembly protein FlgD
VDPALFVSVEISSSVVTPNGDGHNDELQVALDVINLIEERPLSLRVIDLSGRVIRNVVARGVAGQQQLTWDVRDEAGKTVAPGDYLLELSLKGDGREERLHRLVSVAY